MAINLTTYAGATKEWSQVVKRASALDPLRQRMKRHRDMFYLKPYVLKHYDGKTPVKRVENVTLPWPRAWGKYVLAGLTGSHKVFIVRGKDLSDKERDTIKGFMASSFKHVNNEVKMRQRGTLDEFLAFQAAIFGGTAARVWGYFDEDNEYKYGVQPWDMQWVVPDETLGNNWIAYEMGYTREEVEHEFGVKPSSINSTVVDFIDKEKYLTMLAGKIIKERENPYGYVPAAMNFVGSMAWYSTDDADIQYLGDGIFSPLETIYEHLNKLATIEMTVAARGFKGPLQFQKGQNSNTEMPDANPYDDMVVVDVGDGEYKRIPITDLSGKLERMYGLLDKERQRATVSDTVLGDISGLPETPSAVALAKLAEPVDNAFVPLNRNMSNTYTDIAKMIRDQFIKNKAEVSLTDMDGKKETTYKSSDIDKNCNIEVELHRIAPMDNVANATLANALRGWLPDDMIREDIMKIEEEGNAQEQLDIQGVMELVPELRIYIGCKSLIAQKRYTEARYAAAKLGMTLDEASGKDLPKRLQDKIKEQVTGPVPMPVSSNANARIMNTELQRKGIAPQSAKVLPT